MRLSYLKVSFLYTFMSFNDFPTEYRENMWKTHLDATNDFEAAAGVFLQAADQNDDYPQDGGKAKVIEEVIDLLDIDIVIKNVGEVSFE